MKKIKVSIEGPVNSGKSRITYIIKEALNDYGFDVEFTPSLDYKDENTFNRQVRSNLEEVVQHIKDRTKVIVEEKQTNRSTF